MGYMERQFNNGQCSRGCYKYRQWGVSECSEHCISRFSERRKGGSARGKAHIRPRKYTDRNGNEREANDVERFIPCDDPDGLVEAAADSDLPWEKSGFYSKHTANNKALRRPL